MAGEVYRAIRAIGASRAAEGTRAINDSLTPAQRIAAARHASKARSEKTRSIIEMTRVQVHASCWGEPTTINEVNRLEQVRAFGLPGL